MTNQFRSGCLLFTLGLAGLLNAGCNSNASTAALAAAVGIGAGVPLATRSHIEVKVEAFNEQGLPGAKQTFLDADSPLLSMRKHCRDESLAATEAKRKKAIEAALQKLKEVEALENRGETREAIESSRNHLNSLRDMDTKLAARSATDWRALITSATTDIDKNIATLKAATTNPQSAKILDAIEKDISAISSSTNVGFLSEEVMQVVLGKGPMLDEITKRENAARWRPFSEAVSEGGTGDHNAVIYFENMGFPVLKSSRFDPTKFIEAFGKTYQVAFGAIANAFGVPVKPGSGDGGSGEKDKSGTIGGLDVISSDFRKGAAEEKQKTAKAALLKALEDIVKEGESVTSDLSKEATEKLKKKLGQVQADLESIEVK